MTGPPLFIDVVFWNHLAQRLIRGERVPDFSEEDARLVMDWDRPRQV